jgi:superfamily II DNA/RNA helicase
MPSDREQYIHRLGRTGRKGKEGQGILILAPWETCFLNKIKDLPVTEATPCQPDLDCEEKVMLLHFVCSRLNTLVDPMYNMKQCKSLKRKRNIISPSRI